MWKKSEEIENVEIISVKCIGNQFKNVDLSAETTAYRSSISFYYSCGTWDVDLYSFEVESLESSYLALGSDREDVTASLVHSLIFEKYSGVEKLRGIRRYYEQYLVPKWVILEKALRRYLRQTDWNTSYESEIFSKLSKCYYTRIPLFPYRMQLVALLEQEIDWRVLQASAHADAYWCLLGAETDLTPLHQLDTKPCNLFDYYSNIARNEFEGAEHPDFTGLVIESVRSLLGEWQMGTTQEVEWKPAVSLECFDFHTPLNIINGCSNDRGLGERMIWV